MTYNFKNIKHLNENFYSVNVEGKEIKVEITEDVHKNLIGLGVISESLDEFEEFIIRGVNDFSKRRSHKKKQYNEDF